MVLPFPYSLESYMMILLFTDPIITLDKDKKVAYGYSRGMTNVFTATPSGNRKKKAVVLRYFYYTLNL